MTETYTDPVTGEIKSIEVKLVPNDASNLDESRLIGREGVRETK